jgi:hypothetical protein
LVEMFVIYIKYERKMNNSVYCQIIRLHFCFRQKAVNYIIMEGIFNNEKKDKVLILSAIDPTRAYSCIKYLCQYLYDNDIEVECWSSVSADNIQKNTTAGR